MKFPGVEPGSHSPVIVLSILDLLKDAGTSHNICDRMTGTGLTCTSDVERSGRYNLQGEAEETQGK
jgi:hypothetical protein